MSSRFMLPLGLGVIAGSAITLFYNNPRKVHKRWHWDWDGRFDSYSRLVNENPENYPVGKRTITLIRHSQYQRKQGDVNLLRGPGSLRVYPIFDLWVQLHRIVHRININ